MWTLTEANGFFSSLPFDEELDGDGDRDDDNEDEKQRSQNSADHCARDSDTFFLRICNKQPRAVLFLYLHFELVRALSRAAFNTCCCCMLLLVNSPHLSL
jgi:hypothetical protein